MSDSERDRPGAAGLEKQELEICFIPIVCSAPLIYAHSHGFFERNGLHVDIRPAPGWSGIKDLAVYGRVDAVHMLSPMPLACSLGIDGRQADIRLAAIQNVNGQALTLSKRHLGIESIRDMKGLTFGVPYRFSMHYYLLCYLLAANGVDPLKDVTIREVAPPRMPYYLEKGWVDGVFAPEPFNQIPVYRGTGFIHTLSKDIWDGHPCCCFATSQDFIDRYPNTYGAMLGSVLEAELALHRAGGEEKEAIAREICDPKHLNQEDSTPVEQVLTGEFPDGKGVQHTVPDRIDFVPYPWPEYGSWILSQMQRWAQLPGKVDYRELVDSVFQTKGTLELAEALGFRREGGAKLDAVEPFTGQDPFGYMIDQRFCAFKEQAEPLDRHDLPPSARERLTAIVERLADAAGGQSKIEIERTSDGEIGLLEQTLQEMALNLKFMRDALAEERDKLRARTLDLEQQIAERGRAEEIVAQQAAEILEISTPVMQIWDGVVVAPLVGTFDSQRAQQMTERLLDFVARTGSPVALIDITGVPTVDTQTAQHLVETIAAVRLLGSQVVLTGVRPAIAQTLVHLGVSLVDVTTRSSLSTGLQVALDMLGCHVDSE